MQHAPTTAASPGLERILCEARRKTVLILGDVILDEYVTGEVKRISPEAPVPVVEFRSRFFLPGGAANVAANLTSLGCRTMLVGVTGVDTEATHLSESLEKTGVCADFLVLDGGRPTTLKQRLLAHNQQIARLDRELRTPIASDVENALLARMETAVAEADVCVLSDYGKGVVTARVAEKIIALCRNATVPVLVDPKSLSVNACRGATLVKPNRSEAERLAQREMQDEAQFLDVGRMLVNSLEGSAVLITRGALGMSLFRPGMSAFHVPTVARNVFDVTGAGDTVISTLAMALAAGANLEQAVWLASQSAAIVVEKLGTATVTVAELRARCRLQSGSIES